MADYAISNVARRVVYTNTGVGPYAFTFEILQNTDIAVYRASTLLTLTTDYTVIINANGTGSVTLVVQGTGNITIVGARAIQRTSDYTTGGDLFASTLNLDLDSQTIYAQQVAESAERGLKAPVTDPTSINMTLPDKVSRAGKTLAFDTNGNPVVGEDIGNYRGNWTAGLALVVRDLVKDTTTSNIFRVNTAHTSTGALPLTTNVDAAKFDLVVDAAAASASATAAAASASAAASSASAASTSASNASTSATNASTSATNAASSASTASTAATTATNQATAAGVSAASATSSATSATASATSATSSATSATASATSATSSASTATTQATNASNSASAASTSATNASNSASSASTSASNASTSATNAAASAASALAALDDFTDVYLGAFATDPTLDNDGNALTAGDLYFNTGINRLKVYSGAAWSVAVVDTTTVVEKTSTTGAAIIPAGTTAQRDGSPANGYFRYNSSLASFEGYVGGAWGGVGGAQAGGVIFENALTISSNYTLSTSKNGLSVGPITISSGAVVTIPSGQRWVVL